MPVYPLTRVQYKNVTVTVVTIYIMPVIWVKLLFTESVISIYRHHGSKVQKSKLTNAYKQGGYQQ